MLDAPNWLDELADIRFSGVTGVTGVQPQKTVGLEVTHPGVQRCDPVCTVTPAHLDTPAGVTVKPAENSQITPVTPLTPQNDMKAIEAGLIKLRGRRPPKVTKPVMWHGVVLDAVQIHAQGWVEKALSLGWSILDLYGIGAKDSHDFAGLAFWLDGRKMLLLDADRAVALGYDGKHHFKRGGFGHGQDARTQPVPIWEFGL